MQNQQPKLLHGNSQIATVDEQSVKVALRSKSIVEAFLQPTVAMAIRELGHDQVLIQMTAGITKAMQEYFSPEKRMDPEFCMAFAETIIEDYPNESVGDVTVFIKYASRAKYGEVDEDGKVFNKGKIFGRLDPTLLNVWWQQYLGEKADNVAVARVQENRVLNDSRNNVVVDDRVLDLMKKVRAEEVGDDPAISRRIALLIRTVQHMGDERLRHAWTINTTRRERLILLEEANRRGLVQKKIETHIGREE
jgi:hypothetical protein